MSSQEVHLLATTYGILFFIGCVSCRSPLQVGDVSIKFTFDDYQYSSSPLPTTPDYLDYSAPPPSLHYDPSLVQAPRNYSWEAGAGTGAGAGGRSGAGAGAGGRSGAGAGTGAGKDDCRRGDICGTTPPHMMKDLQEVTENMLVEDDHTGNVDIEQSEENSASEGRGLTGEEFSLSDGSRCRDKVEVVEQIVYDEVVTCQHKEDRQCQTSLVTRYNSQQVEECKERYIKTCHIQYQPTAFQETLQVCSRPMVKDCTVTVDQRCRTFTQTECWTKREEQEVEEDVAECREVAGRQECRVDRRKVTKGRPVTGCDQVPVELCSQEGCGFRQGVQVCREKQVTVVGEKPVEECQLEPRRVCKLVSKLVPYLQPQESCLSVPREVCSRANGSPRKQLRPVVKRWCYQTET